MKIGIKHKKSNVPRHFLIIDTGVFILVGWWTIRWELPVIYLLLAMLYLGLVERLDEIIERL